LFTACSKKNDSALSLNGTWKLNSFKNMSSGNVITKPVEETREVILKIVMDSETSGILKGKTPLNTIMENMFYVNENNSFTLTSFSITKVNEEFWGNLFVKEFPKAISYQLPNPTTLVIQTPNDSLFFEKIEN
jgi:hypothetical protein